MNRRQSDANWERKKEYLIRSMFAEPSVLSPIPEHQEPPPTPRPVAPTRYSPLPDLIIEKEKRYYYEDETEEFYDRLAVRMKKLYRKMFLGDSVDISDDDFSSDIQEATDVVNFGATDYNRTNHEAAHASGNGSDDITVILHRRTTSKESETASSEAYLEIEDNNEASSAETNEQSENSAGLVESEGKPQENSEENSEYATNEISQTYTEPRQITGGNMHSEDSMQEESSDSTPAVATQVTFQALIHTTEVRELEIMRRQKSYAFEDSLPNLEVEKPLELSPGLNTGRHSIQQLQKSSDTSSTQTSSLMELESNEFNTFFKESTPTSVDISPVIRFKRPHGLLSEAVEAKKRKSGNRVESCPNNIRHVSEVCTKEIATQAMPTMKNVLIQIDIKKVLKDNQIQTDATVQMEKKDIGVQVNTITRPALSNDCGTQTVLLGSSDASTQTPHENLFRDIYIFGGIYYF